METKEDADKVRAFALRLLEVERPEMATEQGRAMLVAAGNAVANCVTEIGRRTREIEGGGA